MEVSVSKQRISMWGLVMLTLANIVNSMGIAVVAGDGYSGIAIFIIACLFFTLPCLLISNFLAVHYKHDGGFYHWIHQAFGQKSALMATWLAWISIIVSFPTFMTFNVGLLAYALNIKWLATNKIYICITSLALVWFFTWVVSRGIKETVRMSMLNTVFAYLVPICVIFILAICWMLFGTVPTHTPITYHNIFPGKSVIQTLALLGIAVFMVAGMESSGYFINYVKDGRTYKKGMTIAFFIIALAPILAILSMLTLIPLKGLSDSNGLMQAFDFAFKWIGIDIGSNIILLLYFVGQMMSIATLLIFGAKAMEAVAMDNVIPKRFMQYNRHGVSYKLVIAQAVIISMFILLYIFIPSLSSAYALIAVIVGIAAISRYIMMFAAAGKILSKLKRVKGKSLLIVISFIGGIFSFMTFCFSFIPPVQNRLSVFGYEALLVVGVLITVIIPIIYLITSKVMSK